MASQYAHGRIASDSGGESYDRSYPYASTSQAARYGRLDDPPPEDDNAGIPTDDSDMEAEPDYTEDPDERIRKYVTCVVNPGPLLDFPPPALSCTFLSSGETCLPKDRSIIAFVTQIVVNTLQHCISSFHRISNRVNSTFRPAFASCPRLIIH
jgi:hypothetical protein